MYCEIYFFDMSNEVIIVFVLCGIIFVGGFELVYEVDSLCVL